MTSLQGSVGIFLFRFQIFLRGSIGVAVWPFFKADFRGLSWVQRQTPQVINDQVGAAVLQEDAQIENFKLAGKQQAYQ